MSKPYLTIKEQIEKLKDKNIYLGNRAKLKKILNKINFQRIMAYRVHFLDNNNKIKNGTKFKDIYRLHEFDKELRDITMPILESIELTLRRQLAFAIGNEGIHAYLNNNIFINPFRQAEFLLVIDKHMKIAKDPKNKKGRNIVIHHINKYSDPLPIYKVVEVLTFGELSRLFENLRPKNKNEINNIKDKIKIIYQNFNHGSKKANHEQLTSWIRELVEVRNICAHYDMLWNYRKQLSFLRGDRAWMNGVISVNSNRSAQIYGFYGVCLIIRYLCTSKKEFYNYLKQLERLFNKYQNIISYNDLGFPNTWKTDLKK